MASDEVIADNELLYRRIPACWYRPDDGYIDPLAFRPNKLDVTGLSLGRASFHAAEAEAAKGRAGKKYFIAVVQASEVRKSGATVAPRPLEGDPGHAEIPELTYDARKTDFAERMIHAIRAAIIRVEGPFDGARSE